MLACEDSSDPLSAHKPDEGQAGYGAALDRITRLAAQFLNTRFAAIGIMEDGSVLIRSAYGLPIAEMPDLGAFWAEADAQASQDGFIVPDAAADPRFASHPVGSDPPLIRFYAGVPLETTDGHHIGSLCVMDKEPRQGLTAGESSTLRDLGELVMEFMARQDRETANLTSRHALQLLETAVGQAYDEVVLTQGDGSPDPHKYPILFANQSLFANTGYARDDLIGSSLEILLSPENSPTVLEELRCAIREGRPAYAEILTRRKDGTDYWAAIHLVPITDESGACTHVLSMRRDISERKRIEQELQRSQRLLQQVADTGPVMIWITDAAGRCTFANKMCTELTGCGTHEALGEGWMRIFHAADVATAAAARAAARTAGEKYAVEMRFRRADGQAGWLLNIGTGLFDDHGELTGYISSAVDITDRKRMEEALRASEERFRAVAENTTELIHEYDFASKRFDLFGPVGKRFGVTPGQLPHGLRPWLRFIHPNDRPRVMAGIRRSIETGQPLAEEVRTVGLDGEQWREVRGVALRDARGRPYKWIGASTKITERKLAEAELNASVERLNLAQKAAGIGVWDFDIRTGLATCSEEYNRIYGVQGLSRISTGQWLEMLHPDDRKGVLALQNMALEGQAPFDTEFRVIWPDGTEHWVSSKAKVYFDAGKPVRMIGINMDITERKRMEEALRSSESKHRLLFETMTQGVVYRDSHGRILSANPAARRVLGSFDQLSGKTLADLGWQVIREDGSMLPADQTPLAVAIRERRDVHGAVVGFLNHPQGESRWISLDVIPQFRPWTLDLVETCVIAQDITEERAVRESLQRQKELLETILEHAPIMFSRFDAQGKLVMLNLCCRQTLGWTIEEVNSRDFWAELYPDPEYRKSVIEFVEAATSEWHNFRTRTRDGRVIDTCWAKLRLSDGTAIGIGQDITARKQAEDQLRMSHESLRQLAARMEIVREEERIRIAREVHDELGQILTSLKIDMGTLAARLARVSRDADTGKRFQDLSSTIDSSISCVRRIASELRPGVLDNLGLSAAIEWQAQEFQSRTKIKCRLAGLRDNIPLSPEQSTAIFRIYQEILTNIARHARAKAAYITMKLRKDDLVLTVRDNGVGIEPRHISDPRALGLLGMKERALLLGGSVTIERPPRGGTSVSVRVPVATGPARAGKVRHDK